RYQQAKFALFGMPGVEGVVVNIDDAAGRDVLGQLPEVCVDTYSLEAQAGATISAGDIHSRTYGLVFNLSVAERTAQIVTRLVGLHSISNLLLISGVLPQLGWSISGIARALSSLRSVGGRLQVVEVDGVQGEMAASEPM